MKYFMAIDAGTGSVRAVIFDAKGVQISIAQTEWSHKSEEGVANSMNFDYVTNWGITKKCISDAIQRSKINPKDIVGVTSSSMREGIVLYDKAGEEIWGVANVDARAAHEVRVLHENFKGLEEELYATSGQTFALGAIPRLLWLKNNRTTLYERVAKISMINDWILYKLSGFLASEPSNGGTSGIFLLQRRDWDRAQMARVGLKEDIFPPVFESGEIIGEVTQKASKETGLATSTKVVMGGGDVQLGAFGLGLVKSGESAILGGSFWQQIVNIDSKTLPPKDMSIRVNPHVVNGLSQAEGITFFSGLVMRWFRDALGGGRSYSELEALASTVPVGSYGILPIFSDSMKYGKWYHASPSFINLSIDTERSNIGSMFRALQENAAIVSGINLSKIEQFSGVNIDTVTFAAGASKGELWGQIVADVIGKSLQIPVEKEATSLGGAMYVGVATGEFKDIAEAKELVKIERTIEPNMENFNRYKEIKEEWQAVYDEQLKLVDRGLVASMWKAPGL